MTDVVIECPSCGTRSTFKTMHSDASEFCRQCDYPLFFASFDAFEGTLAPANGDDIGLLRLPGAGGRAGIAKILCQNCSEPNPATNDREAVCIRCGEPLHREAVKPPPALVRGIVAWQAAFDAPFGDTFIWPDPPDIETPPVPPRKPPSIWIPVAILVVVVALIIVYAWRWA